MLDLDVLAAIALLVGSALVAGRLLRTRGPQGVPPARAHELADWSTYP